MSAPVVEPSACTWCGIARRGHGRQYADAAGWHEWAQPSQEQILARMKARRLQLAVARAGALPMPVAGERTLDVVEEELTGVNLALWEEIQAYARLRLALASAKRDRSRLRARVAELEAQREALAERLRAGQQWRQGRNPELVSENFVSQSELRSIFGIPLVAPWADGLTKVFVSVASLREPEGEHYPHVHPPRLSGLARPARDGRCAMSDVPSQCRCDEPDADPYECEADDCSGYFSELNPFGGGGPVEGRDAKVSRTCGCGWSTSVWHVDDGSAEAELHGHVVRVHGGTYPARTGGA